jgi:hypothetical protein
VRRKIIKRELTLSSIRSSMKRQPAVGCLLKMSTSHQLMGRNLLSTSSSESAGTRASSSSVSASLNATKIAHLFVRRVNGVIGVIGLSSRFGRGPSPADLCVTAGVFGATEARSASNESSLSLFPGIVTLLIVVESKRGGVICVNGSSSSSFNLEYHSKILVQVADRGQAFNQRATMQVTRKKC